MYIGSKRNWKRNDIISEIMKFGDPIIVVTDVFPSSSFVVKLASVFGARLIEFERSLNICEKRELISRYIDDFQLNLDLNVHERDALAAALKVLYSFKPLFSKAEAQVADLGVNVPKKALRTLLLKGYNIKQAIDMLMKVEESKTMVKIDANPLSSIKIEVEKSESSIIEDLKRKLKIEEDKVKNLSMQRDELLTKINRLKAEIERLNIVLNNLRDEVNIKIKRDREISLLESRLNEIQTLYSVVKSECEFLKTKINEWNEFLLKVVRGEIVIMKPIKNLTLDDVNNSISKYNIGKGDIVFVHDANIINIEALKKLANLGCNGIVVFSPSNSLYDITDELEIPLIEASTIQLKFFENYPYTELNILKSILDKLRSELRERAYSKRMEKFKKIFNEYKAMRLKELEKFNFTFKY